MPKQLTVHNATITTASVEVKTLTISGKQVTLAVFRQLRDEQLIAEEGTLNGAPWGYVNYHPDKCDGSAIGHRHYVWQRGSELLRATVDNVPSFDKEGRDVDDMGRERPRRKVEDFYPEAGDRFITAAVHAWLSGELEKRPHGLSDANNVYPLRTDADFACFGLISGAALQAVHSKEQIESGRLPSLLALAKKEYDAAMAKVKEEMTSWPSADPASLREALQSEVAVESARRQRHRDVRAELAELPQLFIAV